MQENKDIEIDKPEILSEDLCSMAEIANELSVHVASVHRWRIRGVRGVKLEAIRIGGKILTSWQAVTRFLIKTQGPFAHKQLPRRRLTR